MNEITKIHLGRQAFTIAVDAHKALQKYLHDIERESSKDVVDEVELRMAELLAERGVGGDKVVLAKDVAFLKEQLGEPGDFGDEGAEKSDRTVDDGSAPKRLFRDTENGMIAGVAAGVAKYFGTDPFWVRLAFVLLTLAGASGVLLYIVLWLILPDAKTQSERLQMHGRAVTVDNIKEVVERADVRGAAKRASGVAGRAVHKVLKVILTIAGVALTIGGVAALLGLTTGSVYFALNHDVVMPFGIFPVGVGETVLVGMVVLAVAMVALFLLITGLSMVKRTWQLPGWGVGAMVGIFLASIAVGSALAADAAPKVRDRYEAAHHSDIRSVDPFSEVNIAGGQNTTRVTEVVRRNADQYKVELRYLGKADSSGVTVKELKKGSLEVNVQGFKSDPSCVKPCVFADRDLQVIVYAPAGQQIGIIQGDSTAWYSIPDYQLGPEIDYR